MTESAIPTRFYEISFWVILRDRSRPPSTLLRSIGFYSDQQSSSWAAFQRQCLPSYHND